MAEERRPNSDPIDLGQLRTTLEEQGAPWQSGFNSITALTEQQRVTLLGVPVEPGISAEQIDADTETAAALAASADARAVGAPTAFDLRNINGLNYSTPVRNQGNCGSCVAFGVIGTLEGIIRYTKGAPNYAIDLSEAHLFYCHGRAAGARCNTGWWPDQALNASRDQGVTFEDYYPYTAGDQDCTGLNADWANRLALVTQWRLLSSDPAAMKEYISTFGSITACMYVFQDFFAYRSGVYKHVSGDLAGGHCITLIGYDDAQQCWIGKNSWGTGWGEGGYFKIAYGQCKIETYQTCGVQGVRLKAWLPNQQILGLWTNEHDANVWAYGSQRGWLKLDGASVPTNAAMLAELAAAKAGNKPVGLFEDNGSIQQIYAW
ncbi:MAG TPA: C1 family peptidase [Candidatus Limnocylindrales bacterium]|nr:C1 family peptidase [Candidatus Limnocylindrales bacterium]